VKAKNLVRFAVAIVVLGFVRADAQPIKNNVSPGIQFSKDFGRLDASFTIDIMVHLVSDKAAFEKSVDALYDRNSPAYHHWMTNDDPGKYAPRKAQTEIVRPELKKHGLAIMSTHALGFTMRGWGSVANAEGAFLHTNDAAVNPTTNLLRAYPSKGLIAFGSAEDSRPP
jgi:hypothetical protein